MQIISERAVCLLAKAAEHESLVTRLVEGIVSLAGGINKDIVVFIISMIPILELRGGLIAAALLKVPYIKALILCMVGNIIPIPFILLFINKIFEWLKGFKATRGIVERLEKRAMGKSEKIQRYEFLGLMLFVGIPLPGTGAWTGSLVSALLGIKLKKAVPAIFLGILLASAIMSFATYGVPLIISLM